MIILEVSRLSQSMRDLATTVETIVDENDTGLHILDMSLAIEPGDDDPYQRAFVNIMGTITQLDTVTRIAEEAGIRPYRIKGGRGKS